MGSLKRMTRHRYAVIGATKAPRPQAWLHWLLELLTGDAALGLHWAALYGVSPPTNLLTSACSDDHQQGPTGDALCTKIQIDHTLMHACAHHLLLLPLLA